MDEDLEVGELSPGATERRWEPEGGIEKHRDKIHEESRYADEQKNLPFTFSKPKKGKRRKIIECSNCGKKASVSVNTVGIVCNGCHSYASIKEVAEYGE
jgi:DNA-directed RNA polymerase subunit RPC12/RpoP